MTSIDSDQPINLPSMARVPVNPSLDSLEAVDRTCNQRRLIRLQMHRLSLCWPLKSYSRFYRALARFSTSLDTEDDTEGILVRMFSWQKGRIQIMVCLFYAQNRKLKDRLNECL